MAKTLVELCSDAYSGVLPITDLLPKAKGDQWSGREELPPSLSDAVTEQCLKQLLVEKQRQRNNDFRLITSEHEVDCGVVMRQDSKPLLKTLNNVKDKDISTKVNKDKSSRGKKLLKWKTSADIVKFTESETNARKTDRKRCVTKRLDQRQWRQVKAWLLGRVRPPSAPINKEKQVREVAERVITFISHPEQDGQS